VEKICRTCDKTFTPTECEVRNRYIDCRICRNIQNRIYSAKKRAKNKLDPEKVKKEQEYQVWHKRESGYYDSDGYLETRAKQKTTEKRARKFELQKIRRQDPYVQLQRSCNGKVFRALKNGKLVKKPCEVCGAINRIEAHHEDYSKPLEVRWLCMKHHKMEHRTIQL